MTDDQSQATCPYCGSVLKKRPQRKTKCPACGNYMYVRTLPTTQERVVVTEARAQEIEAEWATIYQRQRWLETLRSHGISEADFEREKKQLSAKFGQEAKDSDVVWGLFNHLVAKTRDPQALKMLYYEMALFLEEEGRDFRPLLEQAAQWELRHYKQSSVVNKVEVYSFDAGNSCEACRKQHGTTYSIEEALRLMPIPCKDCTHTLHGKREGFCRCTYRAVL